MPTPGCCHLVEVFDARLEKAAAGRPGALGRGGMVSKLQAAKKAGAAGLPTLIGNGLIPGILPRLFAGEQVGTFFLPQAQKLKSRQYWLAYNVNPKGAIRWTRGPGRPWLSTTRACCPPASSRSRAASARAPRCNCWTRTAEPLRWGSATTRPGT